MSSKHQVYVYECKNCGYHIETMDQREYLEKRMKDETYSHVKKCCDNIELEETDRYMR